ncbi:phosphoribosyltransferase [Helicobacter cetorum]|uniref:Phosphoribosyltransferase n=1 Tax=Helicobacter cetorum (strain ATCC BAA-429 / MIT 00-7128) TaxID=182217 RepID=I0ELV6_HELC0|nr:phosphoribosyltransferase [Helicobacter cetorum]AFI03925.1 hypothetical protein HCW_03220 [Helicobacter cetorum MIT 00-7128]
MNTDFSHITNIAGMHFSSEEDALNKLINEIHMRHVDLKGSLMLALSFNALFLVDALAKKFGADYDILFSEPILAPLNPKCEIALVSESMDIIMNENLINSFDIALDYVYGEAKRVYEENILSQIYQYRKGNAIKSLKNRNIFIVDRGIETGLKAGLAVQTCLKKECQDIYILTPIVAQNVAQGLEGLCDGVISVYRPECFVSIEHHYEGLRALDNKEIEEYLGVKGTDKQTKEN